MTFEEVLKSKGWTDTDLTDPALKPVLERLRPVVEEQYQTVEKMRGEYNEYRRVAEDEWTPAVNARITAAEKEAVEARRRAADYEEQLKIAKDYGLLPTEEQRKADNPPIPSNANPDLKNYITRDDIGKFADMEGDAIAMAHDVSEEYRYLSDGKSLFDYKSENGTGLRALRTEAVKARKNINDYVAEKFKFGELRQKKEDARKSEWEAKIRSEEAEKVRAEMAGKYGNPMMRSPMSSSRPFIPSAPQGGGKQPWEQSESALKSARINRAAASSMKVQ